MTITGLHHGKSLTIPSLKFPNNTQEFCIRDFKHSKYPDKHWAVVNIEENAFVRVLQVYSSAERCRQIADTLQQAYNSGEKEFVMPEN